MFRFVDHDMMMHFHPGLGVGHVYAHGITPNQFGLHSAVDLEGSNSIDNEQLGSNIEETLGASGVEDPIGLDDEISDRAINDGDTNICETDDEEFLAMDEMYGS